MISRRTETSRVALFVLDQVLLACAFAAACALKRRIPAASAVDDAAAWAALYAAAAPLIAIGLWSGGLYRLGREPLWPRLSGGRVLLWGAFAAMVALDAVLLLKPGPSPVDARAVAFLFLGLAVAALWFSRALVSRASRRFTGSPDGTARLVVFGMSRRVLQLLATFQRDPHLRMTVLGVAAENPPADVAPRLLVHEALALVDQGRVDHVLVEAEALPPGVLQAVLGLADREGISVHITSAMFPTTNLVPSWERIAGVPVLGFVSAELPLGARVVKRSFDVSVALLLLALLAVPMALIAVAVRLSSPGPALFVQRRVGGNGRTFPMLKFRTMRLDAEQRSGPVTAVADDPRCTSFGRRLRRTNLDELPQLGNVLFGQRSLVGPRPGRPEFMKSLKRDIPRYAHRHWVKPGITGWAQIHGLRGAATSLPARVDHDLYYIENWSLLLDIRILVRTVFDGYLNAA